VCVCVTYVLRGRVEGKEIFSCVREGEGDLFDCEGILWEGRGGRSKHIRSNIKKGREGR